MLEQPGQSYSNTSAGNTKVEAVVSVAAYRQTRIFNLVAFNPDASATSYVQFFDARSANVTLGTTVPKFVLPLPPTGGVQTGLEVPYGFAVAVTYAVTSTASGSSSPASNAVISFEYV